MIDRWEWDTLCQRRIRVNAIMVYRVKYSLVAVEMLPKFSQTGAAMGGNRHGYRIPFCRTTVYKESFLPSTIRVWNQLPKDAIVAKSLESFKIQGFAAPYTWTVHVFQLLIVQTSVASPFSHTHFKHSEKSPHKLPFILQEISGQPHLQITRTVLFGVEMMYYT